MLLPPLKDLEKLARQRLCPISGKAKLLMIVGDVAVIIMLTSSNWVARLKEEAKAMP